MIERIHGKYYGCCDICGKETEDFRYWEECKDFIKDNWKMKFDHYSQQWQHFCDDCKNLK